MSRSHNIRINSIKAALLVGSSLSMMAAPAAFAQDAAGDEVVVTGTRQVIQDSIVLKRDATTVVDGLSASEIGELPGLSIGDALETLTGVSSQREGSGATTVSVRGLGPFLGSTVINGREATNGSGDRSVNFSQFPSELFNKLEVFKTQEASFIEGGVSGQIALTTLKPLDYGKQRIQLQAKGSLGVDNLRLEDATRDFGYRLTGSYVDQFETKIGDFGISIGGQLRQNTNPEQEARSSSTFQSCTIASLDGSSCNGSSPNISAEDVDDVTGDRIGLTEPFVLTSSSRSFRQNITDDSRDSIFAAAQWQPNDRFDINVDIEYADRTFEEFRSDLVIDANDIEEAGTGQSLPIDGFGLTTTDTGALRTATTTGDVQAISQFSERLEEYIGFGGNIAYQVNDRLNVSIDGSYSDTSRRENQISARVASQAELVGIEVLQNGSDAHQFTLLDFDVNDPSLFINDNPEVREDLNQFRNHEIWAIKGDAEYELNHNILNSFKAGARYSVQSYDQLPRVRNEFEFDDGAADLAEFVTEIDGVAVEDFGSTANIGALAAAACQRSEFPESDFLNGEINGNLFTNIDSDGNVIDAGTGNTFLTFNALCLGETLLGRSLAVPNASDATGSELVQSVDIEEETIALYGQFDYETQIGNFPVRGNIGVRYIDTELTSDGFRSDLSIEVDENGLVIDLIEGDDVIEEISDRFSYSEFLPSFNFVADVNDDVLVRGGIFRAISRPDPSDLGIGRTFSISNLEDGTSEDDFTVTDVIGGITAQGNPRLEPFTSWNFDVAAEWYPDADSILAVGAYYKTFRGGFQNSEQEETFVVNGETFTQSVGVQTTTDENSEIFGVEVTASHAFSYLPGYLSGLGFKASYNYADSNFDFDDGQFGDAVEVDADGNVTGQLTGIIAAANLPGFSKHSASGQVYYDIGDFNITGIVKYRSSFFQQFINTPQNLRFIDPSTVFDARASYKINDNIKLSIEGTNIFNESRDQFNPTRDNFAEINVFGPRYFVGLRAKF